MTTTTKPTTHTIGTREAWRAARLELLAAEKELTRQSDELARQRQALPWVRVEKPYRLETEAGPATLADLFGGRSQLLVYHFMFGPDYAVGCPSCSSIADGFDGIVTHLEQHDVALWAVSRAPLAKLLDFRRRMGWRFPWASCHGGDFNFDFNAHFTEEQQHVGGIEYNYRREPAMAVKPTGSARPAAAPDVGSQLVRKGELSIVELAATTGTDVPTYTRERPGVSAFALEDGVVYHTYSTYARGLDALWGVYQWLDRAPAGRNEHGGYWLRHRDAYPGR